MICAQQADVPRGHIHKEALINHSNKRTEISDQYAAALILNGLACPAVANSWGLPTATEETAHNHIAQPGPQH